MSVQIGNAGLDRVKGRVNSKAKMFERLKELRSEALPWQQRAIDRVPPLLASLAENTNRAIEHLNRERRNLHSAGYREAIGNMYFYAHQVQETIAVKLDYAEARAKLNELEGNTASR